MELLPMRYGEYQWPHNPRSYEIEYKRRIACNKVPFGLYVLSDMGRDQRIMRGEGEFVGAGAYDEFKKLACMFYLDKPQLLVHPVWQVAPAWFVGLRLKQEPRKDYVSYEFEFWECFDGYGWLPETVESGSGGATEQRTERKTYTLRAGDSLWRLAGENGLSMEGLLSLNPQIRNPNVYHVGDLVYLS